MTSALNPRFTFETFVVGAANRLAVTAGRTVSENPGSAYNPLFIYSGSGLGKTHVLMAIGHAAEWAVRTPFCLMGVLGILAVYLVAARFVSRRAGLLSPRPRERAAADWRARRGARRARTASGRRRCPPHRCRR